MRVVVLQSEKPGKVVGPCPRTTWIHTPPSDWTGVRCHIPTFLGPSSELGTSSTTLHTFLPAKKSSPVNCRLFNAPWRSKKNGSLRQPAKKW